MLGLQTLVLNCIINYFTSFYPHYAIRREINTGNDKKSNVIPIMTL